MQCCVLGVAAFIEHSQIGFVAEDDAHESVRLMVLSEVCAKTALSVLNWLHGCRSSESVSLYATRNNTLTLPAVAKLFPTLT